MSNSIGKKIRQIRLLKGYSQENVAFELGMSNGNYGKIERGEIDIDSTMLLKLANVLKVNVCEFFNNKPHDNILMERKLDYGFATKYDIEILTDNLQKVSNEVEKISAEIFRVKSNSRKKKG